MAEASETREGEFSWPQDGSQPSGGRSHRALRSERYRTAWRWLRPCVGLALLGLLLWRVDWREMAGLLSQANMGWIAVALVVELLGLLPRVLRWRALLVAQRMRVPARQLVDTYLIGAFFSNFLPSDVGGDTMRMLRLAQSTGQAADAVSSVLIERLCGLFAVLLLGLAAVLGNWQLAAAGGIGALVIAAFVGFALAMVVLFSLPLLRGWFDRPLRPWLTALVQKLTRLYTSIYAFRRRLPTLLVVTGFSLSYRLIAVLGLYVQALALGLPVPFLWLMMAISLIAVVSALPLSLNALGLKEGAYVFFFGLLGIAAPQALALALLSRAVTMSVSLLGGALYLLGR